MEPQFEQLREGDLAYTIRQLSQSDKTRQGIREVNTGLIMPHKYQPIAQDILDFQVRDDDIYLVSFPKTGTHWMSEMIWLLKHIDNLDEAVLYKRARRFYVLEGECFESDLNLSLKVLETHPSPRLLRSHLPVELLPRQLWNKKPKIIYIARNPKDVAVSLYYFAIDYSGFTGSKELLYEALSKDKVLYAPYWKQVLGFWNLRHEDFVLFTFYEELSKVGFLFQHITCFFKMTISTKGENKIRSVQEILFFKDLRGVIEKVAKFLGVTVSDAQMEKLVHYLDFDQMKENRQKLFESLDREDIYKNLLRKGKTGEGEREMTSEVQKQYDKWMFANLAGTDFPLHVWTHQP